MAMCLACGEDSQGRIAKVFKRITGLSPSQYREEEEKMKTSHGVAQREEEFHRGKKGKKFLFSV